MSDAVQTTKATYALIAEAFAHRARRHMQGTGSPEIEADLDFIAAQVPLRAGSLDAIWCQAAFLHIPREYAPTVLSEFARTVRPGGVVHLAVAEGDGEGWEVASNYGSDARRWFCRYREKGLSSLLAIAGFEVLGVRHWTYYRDWLGVRARRA